MAKSGPQLVAFEFPALGLDLSKSLAQQEAGTSPDLLNVVPFEPATGRGRGGQRAGLSLLAPFPAGPVQLMLGCDSIEVDTSYISGFTPGGSNLENNLTYPAVVAPASFATAPFNAQEASPWAASIDNTNLGNAVFHIGTAAADSSVLSSANCTAFTGTGVGNIPPGFGAQYLTLGTSRHPGDVFMAMKRTGTSAPAGAWSYTYAASITASFGSLATGTVYLLAVADGSGGSATGNLAAGVGLKYDGTFTFVTLSGSAAPTVIETANLVAQFNTLFPTAPGGPLVNLVDALGNPPAVGIVLYKQGAPSGSDFYICRVTVTLQGTPYTWYVGGGSDTTQPYVMVGSAWGGVEDSIVIAGDFTGAGATTIDVQFNGIFQAVPVWAVSPGYRRVLHQLTVSGGSVYFGSPSAQSATVNGAGIFTAGQLISGAWGQGNGYLVDGTNTWKLNAGANSIAAFTAAPGKGTLPAGCRICVIWRDRLVLANQAGGFEQNIAASRQGDYTDWLVAQPDAQSAWELNVTGTAGHVGQPIMCFAPVNDDLALIGTTGQIFIMDGDPAAGASVTLLSDEIGVLGQTAWDVAPNGVIYFVGTGGFYRWHPSMRGFLGEKALDNLSKQRVAPIFQSIDRTSVNVFVTWDRDRHGCWIFLCPRDGSQGTHYWWDERTEGFFRCQFPASMSPTYVQYLDGDTPAPGQGANQAASSRVVMLGCVDGNIRVLDYTALSDQGTAIASRVVIGPKPLGSPFAQSILNAMEFWLGSEPAGAVNCAWQMQVGDDAVSSFGAAAAQSATFTTGGRQPKQLGRSRGCYATLVLSNAVLDRGWTFEQVSVTSIPGGQNR